jgi:hypothetical protein
MTEETGPRLTLRPRRATPSDVRWAQRADELEYNALSRVRSTAEKWTASLGAILGLGGTVLLVKGREDISTLETTYQVLVGVVLLAALGVALAATVVGGLAAQGTPRNVRWPSGTKLRRWEREQALSAIGRLRTSRVLAIVAVGLIVVAVGLTWFGEAESTSKPPTVVVLQESGSVLCGRLVAGETAGAVQLSTTDGGATALQGGDVVSVVPVSGCPATGGTQ